MCMIIIGVMSIATLAGFYIASITGEILAFRLSSAMLLAFYIVNVIPFFALVTRRLHDTGRSGWMSLLLFIPIVGGIIVFAFMGKPGMRSENRFGPDLVPDSVPVPVYINRLKEKYLERFQRSKAPSGL